MALIILIPALACWIALARGGTRKALLDVYLPCVLLLPGYYILRLPHTPPLAFSDTAIIPLGIAILLTQMRNWRFHWMDLWVLLYAADAGLSEGLSTQLASGEWVNMFSADLTVSHSLSTNLADGVIQFFARILSMILPYMAGKLLIEQAGDEGHAMRQKFVQRMVTLLAIVAGISVIDFVQGGSIWQRVGSHLFPDQYVGWGPQMRWGFGRIAGPYGHAILAGMVFLMGMAYCLWLLRAAPQWATRRLFKGFPLELRGLVLIAIVAGLLMTQSRGPWIGMVLSLIFALLMRALSVARATAVFLIFLSIFSVAAYFYGKNYTEGDILQAGSEEKQSAMYRRQLLTNYLPVVLDRKAFGWGITTYPKVSGQQSIDNQYLLLAVTQGFTGVALFLAIAGACAIRLLWLLSLPTRPDDRALIFAHLAVLIGLLVTLATVYMGEQVVMLYFLFIGWVQGMKPVPVPGGMRDGTLAPFRFQRVLV